MSNPSGYYMEPNIHGNMLTFISDGDLWSVNRQGGIPVRLTSNLYIPNSPFFSPDGKMIAFTGREEGGSEVFVLTLADGSIRRVTYIGGLILKVLGWTPDGKHILFATSASEPFLSNTVIFRINKDGGYPEKQAYAWASSISFGPSNGVVLGRFGRDPAQWKRYRGGRMGEIWIDRTGKGSFKKLLSLESNMTHPLWIGNRIYFMGDHEGYGNLYSCRLDGKDVRRHTDLHEFYLRNPRTDGKRITFHAGGKIYVYDLKSGKYSDVPIDFRSTRRQRMRKFVHAANHLESYDLHPEAHSLAVIARGKPITFAHWEGAVRQNGIGEGKVRYRLARWLHDGKRLVVVSDHNGEEILEIHSPNNSDAPILLNKWDIGRPISMKTSPVRDEVILTNQRQELIWIDLKSRKMVCLDQCKWKRIAGFDWSPDGEWVAYNFAKNRQTSAIKLCQIRTKKTVYATDPVLHDFDPSFGPEGKYLYFLSHRVFDPVPDNMTFDYGFPKGVQPMVLMLTADLPSPFIPTAHAPGEDSTDSSSKKSSSSKSGPPKTKITVKDIKTRILAFPVPEGRYTAITGGPKRAYIQESPVEGTLSSNWLESTPEAKDTLKYYDFDTQKMELLIPALSNHQLSRTGKTLAYRAGQKLRVIASTFKHDKEQDNARPSRESGWIDLTRIQISIEPLQEWRQMFRETWRLLRDQYFSEDMAGVDWVKIHDRYRPLVENVSTRSELSDLLWDLGGELGTSHCYEIGGDYQPPPRYPIGLLGIDLTPDPQTGQYRISHIVKGDSWDPKRNSPLNQPGLNVKTGDILAAINGHPVNTSESPYQHLVGLGGKEVMITVIDSKKKQREITVKTMVNENAARLREWTSQVTEYVHTTTKGKVGYIYMQDMGSAGFSQFHRAFQSEVECDGLIVDVRNNGGGHVSSRLLQKLARKRVGWEMTRYNQVVPSPGDAVDGPIVALCDEFSGSDGDIFAHHFKQLKMGLLIGKRTWGGVVGLNPTHPLVDGTVTTQPEFYNYYDDVGWQLENKGAVPDIPVEFTPQDFVAGKDPQLDRAIKEIKKQLKQKRTEKPEPRDRPSRKHPPWPPVNKK
jgi:tricorn protease